MLDRIRRALRAARQEWKRPAFANGGLLRPAGTRDDDRIPIIISRCADYVGEQGPERMGEELVQAINEYQRKTAMHARTQGGKPYRWQG